jgi:ATP-dependent Clp protease adaptor protein ClpS
VPEQPAVAPDLDTQQESTLAPQWKVLLLNDDVTTFEFVIWILVSLFAKPLEEAVRLTHEVHETGVGLATITNLERAELYVEQVTSLARPRGFPLTATIEPA